MLAMAQSPRPSGSVARYKKARQSAGQHQAWTFRIAGPNTAKMRRFTPPRPRLAITIGKWSRFRPADGAPPGGRNWLPGCGMF